jgi:hypothetical protein
MKRDTWITMLLVIAGVLLAFALFGAGALWKGRVQRKGPLGGGHGSAYGTGSQSVNKPSLKFRNSGGWT